VETLGESRRGCFKIEEVFEYVRVLWRGSGVLCMKLAATVAII
jgi:hypothetical protein